MAKIEKYEDLSCWQQARVLVNQIFELVRHSSMEREYALVNQLKRASISVMTNIAEGFSRYHKKDFIRFLDYSQSSAQEVKSILYILSDQKDIDVQKIEKAQEQCDYCQALVLALLKHVRKSLTQGPDHTNESEIYYLADDFVAD